MYPISQVIPLLFDPINDSRPLGISRNIRAVILLLGEIRLNDLRLDDARSPPYSLDSRIIRKSR